MRTRQSPPAAREQGPADTRAGLSSEQVEARRHQYGSNKVLEKKPHAVLAFLAKFWGLSAWMLEAIAALSWTLHRLEPLGAVSPVSSRLTLNRGTRPRT